MHAIEELEYLIDSLKSLPGVGYKTAAKWAYFLINKDSHYINEFTRRIINAKNVIKYCINCNNFSKTQLCSICSDNYRNHKQICVVSHIEDLQRIEESGVYNGIYYVLHAEINPRKPNEIVSLIDKFQKNLNNNSKIEEIIIATNFTISGQFTSNKLCESLNNFNGRIYRIGLGLPINSALDYADNETIKYSFINKNKIRG
ncbi:MAG: recombination protein RecR [Ureaplasma sp.]|nr:recombination protein RecR [Ureaplasma sp.]MDE7221945.1 recombination protein RecR [Ureaplasma sp.]